MCREQLGKLPTRIADLTSQGAAVFGISIDPPADAARLAHELRLPFPILSDPRMDVIRAYQMKGAAMDMADMGYVVIGRDGRLVARRIDRQFGDHIDTIAEAVRETRHGRR